MTQLKPRGNYIAGEFVVPSDPTGSWVSRSPADLSDELGEIQYSYAAVDRAVEAARQALKSWRKTPVGDRLGMLTSYQAALKSRAEELAQVIAREVGKPLWESQNEVTTMINKVDVTLKESMRYVQEFEVPEILARTQGSCHYKPHGVMAVIGPFNFPGHLPNGHWVPALATGNTIVFKPSEKAPLVAQIIAECFEAAGVPRGVFNLVQGEKEVGRRLCVHEGIDGVLFTGSYEVGTRIKQDTLLQHWKILVLEMGGKNASIIWEDAQLDWALDETLLSAYVTAGQRCSATSRIIIHDKLLEAFIDKFHTRAKSFRIGHPLDNPFMGPLIEQGAVDRYMKFLGIAAREGCEVVMRGKAFEAPKKGWYVTPSICWVKDPSLEATRKSVYQQTELFAPNVAILGVSSVEQAIAQANATQYGLVASVFTASREVFEACRDDLEVGLVNWNKSTVGASSRLPFGGFKKSGNHFPTALPATSYCAVPVASLEVKPETLTPEWIAEAAKKTPGLTGSK